MLTIEKINNEVINRQNEYIMECEDKFSLRVKEIAEEIINGKHEFVFISGPTSSGKTTFSHILKEQLSSYKLINISLDDFYKKVKEMPIKKDGSKNFEAINSINVDKVKQTLKDLEQNKEVYLPILDFKQRKFIEKGAKVKREENSIVIIEGLHALNSKIFKAVSEKKSYKVFIFPDSENPQINRFDLRFIRRMVRDFYYRNASAKVNFEMWKNVRQGEKIYMPKYKKNADVIVNSFIEYELGAYKKFALPMLHDIYNIKSKRLINLLNKFKDVDVNMIPTTSLLNEFIYTSDEKER